MFGKRRAPESLVICCPLCGHEQEESSLVISTNCRGCKGYLKINKKRVTAPDQITEGPRFRSSLSSPEPEQEKSVTSAPSSTKAPAQSEEAKKKDLTPLPLANPAMKSSPKTKAPITSPPPLQEAQAQGKAVASQKTPSPSTSTKPARKKPPKPKAPPPPPKPSSITKETQSAEGLAKTAAVTDDEKELTSKPLLNKEATPAPEPTHVNDSPLRYRPPSSTQVESSKSKITPLINREKKRSVKCFECELEHEILADSTSALCPHCGSYIGLKDYDIKEQENSRIQTRGNVFVHKKGFVNGITIHAHNLTIEGAIEGGADCTGDFIVRKTGKINGTVKSDRVIIERRAEVDFLSPVEAREVVIDGHVTGSVSCKKLILKKRATLDGDLVVASLSVEEGAKHTGKITMTPLL